MGQQVAYNDTIHGPRLHNKTSNGIFGTLKWDDGVVQNETSLTRKWDMASHKNGTAGDGEGEK